MQIRWDALGEDPEESLIHGFCTPGSTRILLALRWLCT